MTKSVESASSQEHCALSIKRSSIYLHELEVLIRWSHNGGGGGPCIHSTRLGYNGRSKIQKSVLSVCIMGVCLSTSHIWLSVQFLSR